MSVRVLEGDALTVLKTLPDKSVQMCCTSPPYFGLRDYGTAKWEGGNESCDHKIPAATLGGGSNKGHNGSFTANYGQECGKCGASRVDRQLGLEKTPDLYVEAMVGVFREVKRVLRDDGTLWLNIGDSYAGGAGGRGDSGNLIDERPTSVKHNGTRIRRDTGSLKPKDLIGIPWALAKALRDPYYTGQIKDERDRIWLAAMLDAEGCLFIQKRKAGQHNGQGYFRQNDNYGPGIEIANTSVAIVERISALVGKGSICSQGPNENARRKQTIYRWNLRTTESREFVRELYPYLVAKRQQARILYGCPSSGERAEAAHAALKALHRTGESSVDFPAPPSMFEPGFYLRSDIIWNKCNPMPESVTDRPTKSHEYLFLLSKSPTYYYDADAISEASIHAGAVITNDNGKNGQMGVHGQTRGGFLRPEGVTVKATRNKRSVWSVNSAPFPESHFATFPPKLIEPCILAGSAKQACEKCGAPWVRITERPGQPAPTLSPLSITESGALPDGGVGTHRNMGGRYQAWLDANPKQTTGFTPTCDCENNGTGKSVVLDPFGGAGTTGLVADRLGRNALLIELNPKYAEMARNRIHSDNPLFGDVA